MKGKRVSKPTSRNTIQRSFGKEMMRMRDHQIS